jgi:NADH-quinone oxidoreductase subunit H
MMESLILFAKMITVFSIVLGAIPLILHVERRGAAFIQKRVGPNRVGPYGLMQPLADVLKFIFKEDVKLDHTRDLLYYLAPITALVFSLLPLAIIPLCEPISNGLIRIYPEVFQSEMGLLYIIATTSLGPFAILMAGWSSNNKLAIIGSLRAVAQAISYELALTLTILAMILTYSTYDLHGIIQNQSTSLYGIIPAYGIFHQPIAAFIFLVCMFAESNRLPFDLAEGESELVAGYHVEYSSIKFAMFFMAEYIHVITLSFIFVILFMGGYNLLPGFDGLVEIAPISLYLFQLISFLAKSSIIIWLFIWVRWSIPRFRYDQLMGIGWNRLFPVSLLNLIITVMVRYIYD